MTRPDKVWDTEREQRWAEALRIPMKAMLAAGAPTFMELLVEKAIAQANYELVIAWEQGYSACVHQVNDPGVDQSVDPPNPYLHPPYLNP